MKLLKLFAVAAFGLILRGDVFAGTGAFDNLVVRIQSFAATYKADNILNEKVRNELEKEVVRAFPQGSRLTEVMDGFLVEPGTGAFGVGEEFQEVWYISLDNRPRTRGLSLVKYILEEGQYELGPSIGYSLQQVIKRNPTIRECLTEGIADVSRFRTYEEQQAAIRAGRNQ